MHNLEQILKASYRIIEFNNEPGFFSEFIINDNKFLSILKSKEHTSDSLAIVILDNKGFINAIEKNVSDIIILNAPGIHELKALERTHGAIYFFERLSLSNLFLVFYFFAKNFLANSQKYYGLFYFKKGKKIFYYLGLKRCRPIRKRTRHYLSPLVEIEDFFQALNEQNIKYCILRWFEDLPFVKLNEDIDLLVEDDDLEHLHQILDARPGTVPFDVYSKTGKPGSDFLNLPYYTLSLAEKSLNETLLFKDKFKVPTDENYFYLLAYHAVFHKGENSGLLSKNYKLNITSKPDHDYLYHLKLIASRTEWKIDDFTLEGLHKFLESKGFTPPLDTQYKLSLQNQYLKAYLAESHNNSEYLTKYEGLVCFVVREKIMELGLLDELKKYIQKEGFTIIEIKMLEEPYKTNFTRKVRGGNWNQGPWPISGGLPTVIIVALDVYPVDPTPEDYNQHPGITNRRIKNKTEIRDFINRCLDDESKWFNGIHSSDNEIQAVEYLTLAGLDQDKIFEEILRYRNVFETKYPVINVLSQYSKRAKVELIEFNGVKAIKKTFKPMCENFLVNEMEAHKIFNKIIPIPELLETGDNYLITSYIEENQTLGNRINIETLKKCLSILRQIYDAGYSILDFRPGNFLIDNKKNLYLIDFEFLYKYNVKPDFLSCYDLAGIPESLDRSIVPNHHIPIGTKQFDTLWYKYTHVKYDELSQLNCLSTKLKSFFRYYSSKLKKILFLISRKGKRISKIVYRYLP